tara:strand:- start:1873 stop:2154 length:282 start_codon:yes stop_codon:yes gene_type:complete
MTEEKLGNIRESKTGYGQIWNEDGKTFYKAYDYDAIQITQENLDAVAKGKWTDAHGHEVSFDGASSVGGIIWSWGPNNKFMRYLKTTGQMANE